MSTPHLSSDRWRRVKEVLAAALDAEPARRPELLDERCGDDATLRADVEALLHAHAGASSFLEQPAIAPVTLLATDPYVGRRFGAYLIERGSGAGEWAPSTWPAAPTTRSSGWLPSKRSAAAWIPRPSSAASATSDRSWPHSITPTSVRCSTAAPRRTVSRTSSWNTSMACRSIGTRTSTAWARARASS